MSLVSSLRDTTGSSLIRILSNPEEITDAYSIRSSLKSTLSMVAPVFGAYLLATSGTSLVFIISFVLVLISLILSFKFLRIQLDDTNQIKGNFNKYIKNWFTDISNGIACVFLTKSERDMALTCVLLNAGLFPFFTATLVIWVNTNFNANPLFISYIESAFCFGILMGSLFLNKIMINTFGKFNTIIIGVILLGGCFIFSSLSNNIYLNILYFVMGGFGFIIFNINICVLRSLATPKNYLSRMIAGVAFLSSFLNPFSIQFMGWVTVNFNVQTSIFITGVLILSSSIFLFYNKTAQYLLGQPPENIVEIYKDIYPTAFKN